MSNECEETESEATSSGCSLDATATCADSETHLIETNGSLLLLLLLLLLLYYDARPSSYRVSRTTNPPDDVDLTWAGRSTPDEASILIEIASITAAPCTAGRASHDHAPCITANDHSQP